MLEQLSESLLREHEYSEEFYPMMREVEAESTEL